MQAYFNGHNLLASKLRKAGIEHRMRGNAFIHIGDWEAAQELANESDTRLVHQKLDHYARLFCPAIDMLELSYDWGLAQVEYATDVVFQRQVDLQPRLPSTRASRRSCVRTCAADQARPERRIRRLRRCHLLRRYRHPSTCCHRKTSSCRPRFQRIQLTNAPSVDPIVV